MHQWDLRLPALTISLFSSVRKLGMDSGLTLKSTMMARESGGIRPTIRSCQPTKSLEYLISLRLSVRRRKSEISCTVSNAASAKTLTKAEVRGGSSSLSIPTPTVTTPISIIQTRLPPALASITKSFRVRRPFS